MSIFTKISDFFTGTTNGWPDKLDKNKIVGNLLVIQYGYGSYDLAVNSIGIRGTDQEKKYVQFATDSIKKINTSIDIPLGFPSEFVTCYPDVILWWRKLSDETQEKILSPLNEHDFLDYDQKVSKKYLIKIIQEYKKQGNIPECSIK